MCSILQTELLPRCKDAPSLADVLRTDGRFLTETVLQVPHETFMPAVSYAHFIVLTLCLVSIHPPRRWEAGRLAAWRTTSLTCWWVWTDTVRLCSLSGWTRLCRLQDSLPIGSQRSRNTLSASSFSGNNIPLLSSSGLQQFWQHLTTQSTNALTQLKKWSVNRIIIYNDYSPRSGEKNILSLNTLLIGIVK